MYPYVPLIVDSLVDDPPLAVYVPLLSDSPLDYSPLVIPL